MVNLNYKSINNRVVDYSKGQLLEIEISANRYVISELKIEGLVLADITSVSLTSDNFVFVTTQCNTFSQECEAFYKPLADFLERTELNQKLVY